MSERIFECNLLSEKDTIKHNKELVSMFYGMVGCYGYDLSNSGKIDYEFIGKKFEETLNKFLELGYVKRVDKNA
jgi:hypothetical protein